MNEAKRKRYIKAIENVLKSEEMSICHEAIFSEEAIKGIVGVLKEEKCQWVPCDERMPNEDGYYLACWSDGQIEVEWYDHEGWGYFDVVAWMPLPKPYRG